MPDKKNPTKDRTAASNLEVTPVTPHHGGSTDRKNKKTPEGHTAQHRQIPEFTVEPVVPRSKQESNRPAAAKPASPRPRTPERPVRQSEHGRESAAHTAQAFPERPVQRPQAAERPVRQSEHGHSADTPAKWPLEDTRRLQAIPSSRAQASSRAAAHTSARTRKIEDESGNLYRPEDPKKAQRELQQAQKQKELLERRRRLDEEMSLFTQNDKPKNYWVNLLLVTAKMTLICILIVGISGIGFVLGMAKSYLESVPELDFALVAEQDQATVLYDVNNEILGNYYSLENREWAELEDIPVNLQNAVIAIEDVRFRRHMGIDFKRIFASILSNLSSGSLQGGSTITQQLIKNTMLSFEQTYKRKIQEASLALELEKNYSKDEILEAYLNTIYMGGSCYGVKTAAMDYFGKELSELSLRECATLAGMIQNPSRYNPRSNYFSRNNPDRTDNRTNLVLYEMYENGLIGKEDYDAAVPIPLQCWKPHPIPPKQAWSILPTM